jgi:transaldolase
MSSYLDEIKKHTVVVCDTGDFQSIEKYKPTDTTTNPTLLLAASQLPAYSYLVDDALQYARQKPDHQPEWAIDKLVSA